MPLKSDMLVKLSAGHWRIDSVGRWYPNIQGGDGPEDDENDDENDDSEGSQQSAKTFTQSDLDRIATKQRREGKKAANREIMERFGFDSLDEAEKFIEAAREHATRSDDDSDKRLKRIEERERKADEKIREATRKGNTADVVTFLVGEGLSRKEARKAAALVDIDFDLEDLNDDDIAAAVDELKEDMPRLFASVEEPDTEPSSFKRRTPDSTPRGKKPQPAKASDMASKGRERLMERHGHKLQPSA